MTDIVVNEVHQFELEIGDHGDNLQFPILTAGAILSATYSADNEASVDFLGLHQSESILCKDVK